jgi:hypothetical protein
MGGQPCPNLSSWKAAMGSMPERGKRGKEERRQGAWLGRGMGRGRVAGGGRHGGSACCSGLLRSVRESRNLRRRTEHGGEEKKEREKKKKRKEKKRKEKKEKI